MGEPPPSTRLQRLQRQRRNANQRKNAAPGGSGSSSISSSSPAPTAAGGKKTPATAGSPSSSSATAAVAASSSVAKRTPAGGGRYGAGGRVHAVARNSTTSQPLSSVPVAAAKPKLTTTTKTGSVNGTSKVAGSKSYGGGGGGGGGSNNSSPAILGGRGNATKVRASAAPAGGRRRMDFAAPSSSVPWPDEEEEDGPSPSSSHRHPPRTAALGAGATSSSPKSRAVSEGVSDSRHSFSAPSSRHGRTQTGFSTPSAPKIEKARPEKTGRDPSWFQYTNGTSSREGGRSGSAASSAAGSSSSFSSASLAPSSKGANNNGATTPTAAAAAAAARTERPPRSVEELRFYSDSYDRAAPGRADVAPARDDALGRAVRPPSRERGDGGGTVDATGNPPGRRFGSGGGLASNGVAGARGSTGGAGPKTSAAARKGASSPFSRSVPSEGGSSGRGDGRAVDAMETPPRRRFGSGSSLMSNRATDTWESKDRARPRKGAFSPNSSVPSGGGLSGRRPTGGVDDAACVEGEGTDGESHAEEFGGRNPWKKMSRVNGASKDSAADDAKIVVAKEEPRGKTTRTGMPRDAGAPGPQGRFEHAQSANSYSSKSTLRNSPTRPSVPSINANDNLSPPWSRNGVANRAANHCRGGNVDAPSKFVENKSSRHQPAQPRLNDNSQRKRTEPAKKKPQSEPGNNAANRNNSQSVSIRHGGTPVWIHASVLRENGGGGDGDDNGWEWVRGYLHAGNVEKAGDSVEVTVDDPHSSRDLHGNTYSIPRGCNDGSRILLGNAWWSSRPPPSPSPTSVSRPPSDGAGDPEGHGMPPGDLVEMTHLHEPAIVHALRARYQREMIYTNTGAILLALNPFKKLDYLYTREMMELYWRDDDRGAAGRGEGVEGGDGDEASGGGGRSRPPHAYAVAERAYSSMLLSLKERGDFNPGRDRRDGTTNGGDTLPSCNQSILVSGESGAGKTVTTKIIMRYLSILSQRHSDSDSCDGLDQNSNGRPSVEMQVLQSNPVLESFGNARTIRNDNSSRFGKFIEMSFRGGGGQQQGSLLGATIDFYLLEKVRLVAVNPGERNYHVFYELLSAHGMSRGEKRRYMLTSNFGQGHNGTPLTVHDFRMTSMSGTFDRRDGVDDSVTYGELRTAMNTVGFSVDEQDGIFLLVSALLYASNLSFLDDGSSDNCLVYDRDGTSGAVSSLLGVSEDSLKKALTTSIIEARGEVLTKRLSIGQAEKALEATVKAAYGALFAHIVNRINKSIEVQGVPNDRTGARKTRSKDVATIGVLDIFGFESFDKNSFEQLCINYCNECLQQQFNRFVFKAEQAEYEYEGIEWSNIEFPDNQEALDLVEAKRVGIFAVLDEQCRLPRRTDQTFAKAVYDTCESNCYFAASRMQKSKGRFAIIHYAGEVEYDSDSFLLKNKDELPKSASSLLASSTIPLISELAIILSDNDAPKTDTQANRGYASMKRSSSSLARATISGQFVSQLKGLRSRIATTDPHYIRCLKPNDCLVANHFDESLIAHQLNCAGVLPAMKIARAGFAMRYLHGAFIQRYRPIVGQELSLRARALGGHQAICEMLISLLADQLEGEMKQRTHHDAKVDEIDDIVSWGVQVGKSKVFVRTIASEALEELRNTTMNKAAILLQAQARAFLCKSKFYLILGSVLSLQCAARKFIASIRVCQLRFKERSITIQKQWRSYRAWYLYQNVLYISIWCQRLWRGRKVRERYIRIKQYRSAIVIQSTWRSHVFQQCHRQLRSAAIVIQCFYRVWDSNQILKKLKREAKDVQSIAMERDRLRMEMRQMKRELEQAKINRHNSNTIIHHSDSWTTARTSASQEDKIRELSEECTKKDQELLILRREVESLRGSGRSVPSTLPLTVTVDTELPSSRTSRLSPVDLSLLPSGESSLTRSLGKPPASPSRPTKFYPVETPLVKSARVFPNSPSLLDTEVEDLPQLECSQISLPDSSVDYDERVNISALNQTTESSFIDCTKIDELPFHQAVQNDDKEILLDEIQNSSDIELGINSADSNGRTPLHIAVQCSNLELVKILLSNDAVVNTQDFSGNTALHYSCSPEMTQLLLGGGISPNIPNGDGLCSLHFAVKRRDFTSVRYLLLNGADVNNADDEFWYTPLHLVAHAESPKQNTTRSLRGPIAEMLCEAKSPSAPDLNYQDRDGNTPLHHAVSLVEGDAGILISLFIEHGSSPNVANHRGQTPLHLFCHNHTARQFVFYHEALHLMLVKGADPNIPSLSGCTSLHLALYHQDVVAAALLVRHGAQVNTKWKKPQKWESSWTDMGSDDVLPLDMLEDIQSLHKVLVEISTPQTFALRRLRCMHCKAKFGMFGRNYNCTHCGRSVCGKCCVGSLRRSYFPTLEFERGNSEMFKVCSLCEPILLSKMDRVPTTIVGGACDQSSLGTISM